MLQKWRAGQAGRFGEPGDAEHGGSLAQVRRRLDPPGYVRLRLDDRGLLKVLPQETELRRSQNVIFMPMNPLLAFRRTSKGPI
jgi:hypothetical protein